MSTINISSFRQNLPTLIEEVNDYSKRLIISVSGKPKAVVMSLDEMESLEETAEILSSYKDYKKVKIGVKQAKARKGKLLKDLKI